MGTIEVIVQDLCASKTCDGKSSALSLINLLMHPGIYNSFNRFYFFYSCTLTDFAQFPFIH